MVAPRVCRPNFGALVDVADIEEERVGIGPPPLADLRGATGEAAEVGMIVVIDRGQDVAVQIGGVEDGDRDGVGRRRPRSGAGQRGQQRALPERAQKPAPAERGHVNVHGAISVDIAGRMKHKSSASPRQVWRTGVFRA